MTIGPGSIVIHNDTTNTDKMTLGYNGATAQISSGNPIAIVTPSLSVSGGTATIANLTVTGCASDSHRQSVSRPDPAHAV